MKLSSLLLLGAVIALLVVTVMNASDKLIEHYGSFGKSTALENSSTTRQPESPESTLQKSRAQSSRAAKPSITPPLGAVPGSVEVSAIPLQSLVPKTIRGLASLGIAGHGGQHAEVAHAWPPAGGPLFPIASRSNNTSEAAPVPLHPTRPHPFGERAAYHKTQPAGSAAKANQVACTATTNLVDDPVINALDLIQFLNFNETSFEAADFNCDTFVNRLDLMRLTLDWNP